jgi:ABC-type Mn2+/Zn2+ transport system permease subunit
MADAVHLAAALGWLTDPWSEPIMRRAFAEVVLLGVVGGALGCWIVFYELSYGAESLAHAIFPGLVIAALAGFPLLFGGALGLLVAAVAVAVVGRIPEIGRDTAVAVVVTALFGLGALLALSPESPPGVGGLLFGDILGVTDTDLVLAAVLAVVVLVTLRLLHGRLLAVGFDRSSARSLGVSPGVVDLALLILLALAILVAVQGLGNLLVVAVLVGPAATARLLTHRIGPMMVAGVGIAVLSGLGGLYLSYYAKIAAGASIAGVMVAVYLFAALVSAARHRSATHASRRGRVLPASG